MRIELSTGTPAEIHESAGASRGVVVLPDIMGLRPLFDNLVAELATANGWTVCTPEPFPGSEEASLDDRHDLLATLNDDDKLADALAAAERTGCRRVAVIGFCMGGMYTLNASFSPTFDRAVSFYGMIRVPQRWASSGHRDAIDYVAGDDPTKVMAHIGTVDPWTPPDQVDELERTGAVVHRYIGADHGFVHDPSRPTHRPDDAKLAWERTLAFLA